MRIWSCKIKDFKIRRRRRKNNRKKNKEEEEERRRRRRKKKKRKKKKKKKKRKKKSIMIRTYCILWTCNAYKGPHSLFIDCCSWCCMCTKQSPEDHTGLLIIRRLSQSVCHYELTLSIFHYLEIKNKLCCHLHIGCQC